MKKKKEYICDFCISWETGYYYKKDGVNLDERN